MMCFKDMTFCGSDCTNTSCPHYFSEELEEQSKVWWSHDPENVPVAFSNFWVDCKEYTKE